MKKIKITILLLTTQLICSIATAQKSTKIGLGGSYQIPLNYEFKKDFHNGKGFNVVFQKQMTTLGSITSTFTYLKANPKSTNYNAYQFSFLDFGYRTELKNSIFFLGSGIGIITIDRNVKPILFVEGGLTVLKGAKISIQQYNKMVITRSALSNFFLHTGVTVNYKF